MNKTGNIFLIGPMGVGKSTIGRQLALQTNKKFFDADYEIERRTGADIGLIFEIEGEEGFRKREQGILEELVKLNDIILSTGGGVVLSGENRNILSRNGTVIYLRSEVDTIMKRTEKDKKRPLLQTGDRAEKISNILDERSPLYIEIADYIFDTDHGSVKQIVDRITGVLHI